MIGSGELPLKQVLRRAWGLPKAPNPLKGAGGRGEEAGNWEEASWERMGEGRGARLLHRTEILYLMGVGEPGLGMGTGRQGGMDRQPDSREHSMFYTECAMLEERSDFPI